LWVKSDQTDKLYFSLQHLNKRLKLYAVIFLPILLKLLSVKLVFLMKISVKLYWFSKKIWTSY